MNLSFGPSLAERIASTGGKAAGFDYLRLTLAVVIVAFHSVVTTGGHAAQRELLDGPAGPFFQLLLPMFFALSGFLVAGSLLRSDSLLVFVGLRVLRIFPALAVDTLFCALLLGPLLTSLSPSAYFSDPQFHAYLLNLFGVIHYLLPGVFRDNPMPEVNGQLWTIPAELECYVVLTLLALVGAHRRRALMLGLVAAGVAVLQARVWAGASSPWAGRLLLGCFLAGVLLHLFRDRVRWNAAAGALALAATLVCLQVPSLLYLAALPASYLTVWLGLHNPRKVGLLRSGDYSYGLFLYGFPLQQALVATVPAAQVWWGNLLLALPLTLAFAALSWHLFEKRALARKHWLHAGAAALARRWPGAALGSARRP